jgi:hypothetical protein
MNLSNPRSSIAEKDGMPSRVMFVWLSQVSDLLTALTSSGVTGARPTVFLFTGRTFFDTTLGQPIWYDGSGWVDATGTTA